MHPLVIVPTTPHCPSVPPPFLDQNYRGPSTHFRPRALSRNFRIHPRTNATTNLSLPCPTGRRPSHWVRRLGVGCTSCVVQFEQFVHHVSEGSIASTGGMVGPADGTRVDARSVACGYRGLGGFHERTSFQTFTFLVPSLSCCLMCCRMRSNSVQACRPCCASSA